MNPPKKLIAAIAILIGARVLMLLFGTFAFIYLHIKWTARAIKKKSFKVLSDKLRHYYFWLAFADDQKGNVLCSEVFNDWFIKNKPNRKDYGTFGETVSHVTGVNEDREVMYFFGRLLAGALNAIDAKHTTKAKDNPQYKK